MKRILSVFVTMIVLFGITYVCIQAIQSQNDQINKAHLNPKTTKMKPDLKYCKVADDCVPVGCECNCSGCGGFSYEDIVNKKYQERWYQENNCLQPLKLICPHVCCSPVFVDCENNTCVVKPKNKKNIPKDLLKKEKKDKKLCEKTGGMWKEDPVWVGRCECDNSYYFSR